MSRESIRAEWSRIFWLLTSLKDIWQQFAPLIHCPACSRYQDECVRAWHRTSRCRRVCALEWTCHIGNLINWALPRYAFLMFLSAGILCEGAFELPSRKVHKVRTNATRLCRIWTEFVPRFASLNRKADGPVADPTQKRASKSKRGSAAQLHIASP